MSINQINIFNQLRANTMRIFDRIHSQIGKFQYLHELKELAYSMVREMGLQYSFPIGISVGHVFAHSTPSHRTPERIPTSGLIRYDFGLRSGGYLVDFAQTRSIDGENHPFLEQGERYNSFLATSDFHLNNFINYRAFCMENFPTLDTNLGGHGLGWGTGIIHVGGISNTDRSHYRGAFQLTENCAFSVEVLGSTSGSNFIVSESPVGCSILVSPQSPLHEVVSNSDQPGALMGDGSYMVDLDHMYNLFGEDFMNNPGISISNRYESPIEDDETYHFEQSFLISGGKLYKN